MTRFPSRAGNAILPDLPSLSLTGRPVEIRYRSELRDAAGNAAHAATFIRQRVIVLDSELAGNKTEHRRILLHEVLHFAWVRLGNPRRLSWERLLAAEWKAGARGETGWSAEWRKRALCPRDVKARTVAWREYCCESFCDTGAWFYGRVQTEVTLAPRYRALRAVWFRSQFESGRLAI